MTRHDPPPDGSGDETWPGREGTGPRTLALPTQITGVPREALPPQLPLPPELSPRRRHGGVSPSEPQPRRRRRPVRLLRRVLAVLLALAVLLLVYYAGLAAFALGRLDRVDALADYPGRPAATPGTTWLLVGSDSREDLTAAERKQLRTGTAEGRRTDTVLLLHVPPGGKPTLLSLPRDSYVDVPAYGTRAAHKDKLNAAYAIGGAPLLVRTVEQATGLRLDAYAEVGFAGVVDVVDAVGGVDLCVQRAIRDERAGLDVAAGCQTLDGPTALGYVRARYSDPRGDLGRVERQRQFLAALVGEATTPATLLDPVATTRMTLAGADAVTVDRHTGPLDLLRAGRALRAVSGGDGATVTVPVADPDARTPVGSAVIWDERGAEELFGALRHNSRVGAD